MIELTTYAEQCLHIGRLYDIGFRQIDDLDFALVVRGMDMQVWSTSCQSSERRESPGGGTIPPEGKERLVPLICLWISQNCHCAGLDDGLTAIFSRYPVNRDARPDLHFGLQLNMWYKLGLEIGQESTKLLVEKLFFWRLFPEVNLIGQRYSFLRTSIPHVHDIAHSYVSARDPRIAAGDLRGQHLRPDDALE